MNQLGEQQNDMLYNIIVINSQYNPAEQMRRYNQPQNLHGVYQHPYLDTHNRYLRNIYQIMPYKTPYFTRFMAVDTYPRAREQVLVQQGQRENMEKRDSGGARCYVFMADRLGDPYGNILDNYKNAMDLGDDLLDDPTENTVKYFGNLLKKYHKIYGDCKEDIIIKKIFGSRQKQATNFINSHLKKSDPKAYARRTQQHRLQYSTKNRHLSPVSPEHFLQQIEQKQSLIPLEYGDNRLQPLIKMSRQLRLMCGFHIVGIKGTKSHERKVMIKCDMMEVKRFARYEADEGYGVMGQVSYDENLHIKLSDLVELLRQKYKEDEQIASQHTRLKTKFLQQITQQLLQYQFLTGTPYPVLHPHTIHYNTKTDHFTLSPIPIIVQGLGFRVREDLGDGVMRDGCYYGKKFLRDVGFGGRQGEGLGVILDNACKMLLLLHYFQMGTCQREISKQAVKQYRLLFNCLFPTQIFDQKEKLCQIRQQYPQPEYHQYLLRQPSYTQAILLQLLSSPQQKLTLPSLTQLLPLNYRISTLSPSRHEHLLAMRFDILNVMFETMDEVCKVIIQAKEEVVKDINSEQYGVMQTENRIYYYFVFVLRALVAMELRDVLRDEDRELKKAVQIVLYYFSAFCKDLKDKLTVLQKTKKEKFSIMAPFLKIVCSKLDYIYNESKNGNQFSIVYGQIIRKILKFIEKTEIQKQKNVKIIQKCFQNASKYPPKFLHIRQIQRVLVHLLLKLDTNNIYWCQYFIFHKVQQFINANGSTKGNGSGGNVSKEDLYKLYVEIQKKEGGEDEENLWWGNLWGEVDNDDNFTLL